MTVNGSGLPTGPGGLEGLRKAEGLRHRILIAPDFRHKERIQARAVRPAQEPQSCEVHGAAGAGHGTAVGLDFDAASGIEACGQGDSRASVAKRLEDVR